MLRRSGRRRAASVLVLLACALVPGAAKSARAQPGSPAEASASTRPQSRRAFEHQRHEKISCRSCHGTGSQHRTFLVRTDRDCASCHHKRETKEACTTCHERAPEARALTAQLALSVWPAARARALPFAHERHRSLLCTDCHRGGVTLKPDRACASCHESHHRAEATCTSCHLQAPTGAHRESVHLSCGGAGCHAAAVAPKPTLSRTLCLACHRERAEHEPGRTCASCHRIPAAPARRP